MTWILLPIYSIYPFSRHRLLIRLFVGGDPRGHDHNPHIRTPKIHTSCCKDWRRSRSRWSRSCNFQCIRFFVWWWIWPFFFACVNPQLTKHLPHSKNRWFGKTSDVGISVFSPIFVGSNYHQQSTNSLGTTRWWLPSREQLQKLFKVRIGNPGLSRVAQNLYPLNCPISLLLQSIWKKLKTLFQIKQETKTRP